MAEPNKPFTYNIPDGNYKGHPTTASCFEQNGRLILDISFEVINPNTGTPYKKENGYNWEAKKRHWLTTKEGAFAEATINGLKEWAKGWNPTQFEDFYWFQSPDENGTPFGNLAAIGEVDLNFVTDNTGAQTMWVHDPNRPRGRKTFVPDGAVTDAAQIKAKWGSKARALFASSPKPVTPASAPTATAPARPSAAPSRPASAPAAKPDWADFPMTSDGVWNYFLSKLGEQYDGAKHDEKWFALQDAEVPGKDPDQYTREDFTKLFTAISKM